MERETRKKSKMPFLFRGNGDNLSRKTVHPRSPSDGISEQNLFIVEVGKTSSKQGYVTPMKTLLAKEMLNETSAKKQSPNLIAKLMGLDGLPSTQPIHRQPKKPSDNTHKSSAFLGGKRNDKRFSHQSNKKSTMEQQQFKDVYEDLEASHVANQHYSSPMSANRRSTKQELGYIQERCDEMLRESIAIKSKLERVDSNSDLMLSFLQKPDSLFVKHLHDQQRMPSGSLCNQITILKPSNFVRNGAYSKFMKEEKETLVYRVPVSHQINEDSLLDYSGRGANNSYRSSRVQLKRKEAITVSPTQIVVLKPNVAKIYRDNDDVHSPEEHRKNTESEWYRCGTEQGGSERYKGPLSEVRSSRHKSRAAREIARQITSQMKEDFESGHASLLDSGLRGYAGDESLYNMSATASVSESEMIVVPSRNYFNQSDRPRHSSSIMYEPSVIREAKKRMSQRWKTHGYKDSGMVGRGSTLEEMLSIPNSEARHGKTGCLVDRVGVNDEYGSPARSGRTLCIRSKDGWRDGYLSGTSRSRSLPPSFSNQDHRTRSDYHEAHVDEKMVVHNEHAVHRGKSKGAKENFIRKGDLRSKYIRYNKRCQFSEKCNACSPEFNSISRESHSSWKQTGTCFQSNNLAEQEALNSDIHSDFTNKASAIDVIRISSKSSNEPTPVLNLAEQETLNSDMHSDITNEASAIDVIRISSKSSNELTPPLSTCMLGDADSSSVDEDGSNSQEPSTAKSEGTVSLQLSVPEPEYSEGSKEADQRDQLSVMEVPHTDDASFGSDCFERVSSQLHELRKQLHLLKMESGSTYDSPNDEEVEQGSSVTRSLSDNWESTYLTDLLQGSGFYDHNPYMFMTTWYSAECPIDPWLFDHLEKKYEDSTVSRSERRLLYDRINEALFVISETTLSCSWVSPGQRGIQMTLAEIGFEDQVHRMLGKQEKEATDEFEEISIDKDRDWFQPLKEMDVVGKQITELLVDDLVLEVVTVQHYRYKL